MCVYRITISSFQYVLSELMVLKSRNDNEVLAGVRNLSLMFPNLTDQRSFCSIHLISSPCQPFSMVSETKP